jgi:hypothetical protein
MNLEIGYIENPENGWRKREKRREVNGDGVSTPLLCC